MAPLGSWANGPTCDSQGQRPWLSHLRAVGPRRTDDQIDAIIGTRHTAVGSWWRRNHRPLLESPGLPLTRKATYGERVMDLSSQHPPLERNWFRLFRRTLLVVLIFLGCWAGYELNWVRQRHAYASLQHDKFLAAGFGVEHYADHNKLPDSRPTWLVGESGLAKLPFCIPKDSASGRFREQNVYSQSPRSCRWASSLRLEQVSNGTAYHRLLQQRLGVESRWPPQASKPLIVARSEPLNLTAPYTTWTKID